MKLLWVTAKRLGSDLASTTQLAVSSALAARGWKVTIMAPESPEVEKSLVAGDISFVGVSRSNKAGLGWLTFGRSLSLTLPKVLADGEFDVALVGWQGVAGSHKALRSAGTPWLLVDRSPPVFRSLAGRLQWYEYWRALRLAGRRSGADGSVLKSQALADWHLSKGRAVEPITLMEAGVDVSKFSPATFTGTPTIVHHGQLDEEREIERLVRIGEVLSAREIDFKMRIAGNGNRFTALQKAAFLQDWLEVLGPLPPEDIPQFLATGHIAIFPLPDGKVWRLASPLKVREWAAAGLPMVLSNITPHRSVGERPWIRLVAAHAPMDEWADAVEELLGSELGGLGAEARTDAESEFDWVKTTEALHQRMSELAGV